MPPTQPSLVAARAGSRDLTALFAPDSIAVVGASDDPSKYGNWLAIRAVRDSAVRPAWLVNRSRSTVLGRPAIPNLATVKGQVGLAVIAVPAAAFYDAVEDAIAAEVHAIVAITAGLGESGPEGYLREQALVARLRDANILMLGPNCLGVLDNTTALDATVNEFRPGTVSLISQSGNVAIDIARHLGDAGLGVARFASLGNSADLDVADLIESCVDHDKTAVIAVYCEGFQDGRKFLRAASRASSAGKPLLVLSVGRSAGATRGAASHTGSLVTERSVLEAACELTGCELVDSPLQMVNLIAALVHTRVPTGRRVGVLSDGGGHASLASDGLADNDLQVHVFSQQLQHRLIDVLPPTATLVNPVDLAGAGEQDIRCYARAAETIMTSPEVDSVILTGFFGGYSGYNPEVLEDEIATAMRLASLASETGSTFVAQTAYVDSAPARALRSGGVAVYRNVEDLTWTLGRLAHRGRREPTQLPPLPSPEPPLQEAGYGPARRALSAIGIPVPRAIEITSRDELIQAASDLTFPLVLKALVDQHKSDRGGVRLNIRDKDQLVAEWSELDARLDPPSFSVEEMIAAVDTVELIVGIRRDPSFGPVVLVGLGGIYAELLKDTQCAICPITSKQASEMLNSLRGSKLLSGWRGSAPVDVNAAGELVARLSTYGAAHQEIVAIECNPVAVSRHGAVALDARILLGA